jgi:hypothetical protein
MSLVGHIRRMVILMCLSLQANADDPSAVFNDAKAYAQGTVDGTGGIVSAEQAAELPHYTTSSPVPSLVPGSVGLGGAGIGKINGCEGQNDTECAAVNFLAKNPDTRLRFNLDPATDPTLQAGKQVLADPNVVVGAVQDGSESVCSSMTVSDPATVTTEVCNEYKTVSEVVCQKALVIKVTESSSCVTGSDLATYMPGIGSCSKASGPDWWYGPGALKVRCDSFDQTKLYVAAETLVREGSYGASGCGPGVRPNLNLLPYRAINAYSEDWSEIYGDYGAGSISHLYVRGGCKPGQTDCTLEVVASAKQLASIASCPSGQITRQVAESYGCGSVYQDGCYTVAGWWSCPTYAGPASSSTMLCDNGGWSDNGPMGWVNCESIVTSTTLNFQRQHITYVATDSWSDGCVALEARTQ